MGIVPLLLGDVFVVRVDIVGCVGLEPGEALLTVVPGVALVTGKRKQQSMVVKVYNQQSVTTNSELPICGDGYS